MMAKPKPKTNPKPETTAIFACPIDIIDAPTIPERISIDQDELANLAASIKAVGLRQPIAVKKKGKRYEIIHGHRRFLAHQILGKPTIRAFQDTVDERTAMLVRIHENLNRAAASPLEEGLYLKLIRSKFTLTSKALAQMLGRSNAWISERIATTKWPQDIKDAIQAGSLKYSVARELVKVTDTPYRKYLLKYALNGGCSPEKAKHWVEDWRLTNTHNDTTEPVQITDDEQPPTEQPGTICYLCDAQSNYTNMKNIWVHTACLKAVTEVLAEMAFDQGERSGQPPNDQH